MTLVFRIICGAVLVASLCSCGAHSAINRTENFQNAWPAVNYMTKKQVLIEVVDLRPDVLNNSVRPTYVGVMRAQLGNPWSMNTESGQPLAFDLATAIRNGLRSAGIKAVFPDQTTSDQSYERKLNLKIYDWECDTYKTSDFKYDLELQIFDSKNITLGSYRYSNKSEENITVISVVEAGRKVLTNMLNNESILKALKD